MTNNCSEGEVLSSIGNSCFWLVRCSYSSIAGLYDRICRSANAMADSATEMGFWEERGRWRDKNRRESEGRKKRRLEMRESSWRSESCGWHCYCKEKESPSALFLSYPFVSLYLYNRLSVYFFICNLFNYKIIYYINN